MKIFICLSIKNRIDNLRELIPQINEIYILLLSKNIELIVNITDFNSTDCIIYDELKNLKCNYNSKILIENFNLGKGWNISANHNEINKNNILLFLTNDIYIQNKNKFVEDIINYTIINKSVYSPEHLCEDKLGMLNFLGGATFFSIFKIDFIEIGNFPESEYWGMAGTDNGYNGEDGWFFESCIKKKYILNNFKDNNIIAKWHPRDLNNDWYKKSNRSQNMFKNAKHWK